MISQRTLVRMKHQIQTKNGQLSASIERIYVLALASQAHATRHDTKHPYLWNA